jgi:hypothetical protein
MAESSSPLDPFALWRDLVSQVSKDANQWANRGMQTDEFAEGMHKMLGPMLAFGKLSAKAKQGYFEAMNLPSRSDVEALGERLQAVEDKLAELVGLLERSQSRASGGAGQAAPVPVVGGATRLPRTRKPPEESAEPPRVAAQPAPASALAPAAARASARAPARATAGRKKARA